LCKSAKYINEISERIWIEEKTLEKESGVSLYIKDGEEISKLFAFIVQIQPVLNLKK
jgi:DNA-binding transcriptional regulator WhiA